MLGFNVVLFYLPSLAFRRNAESVLRREFSVDTANRIWMATKARAEILEASRPKYSRGVNLLIRYMEWDVALYQSVLKEGVAGDRAGSLVEEINWKIFAPVTAALFRVSRLRSSRRLNRIRWILDLTFKYLFTSPFQRRNLPLSDQVAFDVVACPLAHYFQEQGVPELTRYAACSLDFSMAGLWGAKLMRSKTIAEGDALCDFRFKVVDTSAVPRSER